MRTIVYLMSGAAHCPYLLVSLWTLRKHWAGPVVVNCWHESADLVSRITNDDRLGPDIRMSPREPKYRGKNDQFLDKMQVAMEQPKDDTVLYLDADTTYHGRLDALFDYAEKTGFCATQWNDWKTNGGMIRGRLESIRPYLPEEAGRAITRLQTECWPSVNGGVWACRPDSPVLPLWYDWTMRCTVPKHEFIADEKILHLMMERFTESGQFFTVEQFGRYNSSPKFQSERLLDRQVVVYHYHGDANLRPDKSPKGYSMWWPRWQECLEMNLGGVQDWQDKTGNKWLKKLKESVHG